MTTYGYPKPRSGLLTRRSMIGIMTEYLEGKNILKWSVQIESPVK